MGCCVGLGITVLHVPLWLLSYVSLKTITDRRFVLMNFESSEANFKNRFVYAELSTVLLAGGGGTGSSLTNHS